ncbi:MAG: CBS domain-containing protein, partial [Acidimicrobiales bacterium]
YDASVIDRVVMVSDRDSFHTARRITREEGILVGGSCGTAVWAAVEVGKELSHEAVIVVILPDSGRGYLSKLYNDAWMADYGFLRASGPTIGDVLAAKGAHLPRLVHVHPDETVRSAISILREYEVSQMPVVSASVPEADGTHADFVFADVVGSVTDRDLMERAFDDASILDAPVSSVMGAALPALGAGEEVADAVAALESASAVIVVDAGRPTGVLTRSDLLDFLVTKGAQ